MSFNVLVEETNEIELEKEFVSNFIKSSSLQNAASVGSVLRGKNTVSNINLKK